MTGFFIASRPILAYLIECKDSKNYCFAFLICNVICAFPEAKISYFLQLQYSLLAVMHHSQQAQFGARGVRLS